jgi:ABC-type antimicrobial peptide transport system permease subunit
LPGIRERMHSVDADLALTDITPMDDRVQESLWRQRFSSSVIAALGLAALAIAVLGVYGVTTYLSTLRSHEFGIRMAVGARPADIARLVLGECSIQIALGIAAGLAGAFALARVLQGLLYSVTPADPLTFAAVTVLLAGVALAVCLLPARRAARIDPVTTLHHD